jgi:hypothetical protein
MSDTVLKLIPTDPRFVPEQVRQRVALQALIEAFPRGEDAQAETYEDVTFIENGENTEAVICPHCSARLPLRGNDAAEANEEIFAFVFEPPEELPIPALQIDMPCCGRSTAAMSLSFDWPAGFARFELSIRNPDVPGPLDGMLRRRLEDLLGCPLLEVWAHY